MLENLARLLGEKNERKLTGEISWPSPYVAQGAAQAVEDAASLGVTLSSITSKDQVPLALKAYEKAQKARAEHIQQSCLQTRAALHLPDGPEQEARDQKFRALSQGGESDDKWNDPQMQQFLWGWDAETKAEEAWRGEFPSQ